MSGQFVTHLSGIQRAIEYHDQCTKQTRRFLGSHAFDAAFKRGHSLTTAKAIAYALRLSRSRWGVVRWGRGWG